MAGSQHRSGFGTLSPQPNSRWRAQYSAPDGSRPSKIFDTRKEAVAWLAQVQAGLGQGTHVDHRGGRVLVHVVGERWLAAKGGLKASSISDVTTIWQAHLEPRWGDIALGDVRHSEIRAWVAGLATSGQRARDGSGAKVDKPLSPTRIRRCILYLRQILDLAIRDKLIPGPNPADDIPLPRLTTAEPVLISLEQMERLLRAVDDTTALDDPRRWQEKSLIGLMALCGLRWGEATAVRVRDFNWRDRTIEVRQAFSEINGKLILDIPKGNRARTVPYPARLFMPLGASTARRAPDELLIQSPRGTPIRRSWVRRRWVELRASAGLPRDFTPHDLRASHASQLVDAGLPVLEVARRLGHTRSGVLVAHYARPLRDERAAADILNHQFEDILEPETGADPW